MELIITMFGIDNNNVFKQKSNKGLGKSVFRMCKHELSPNSTTHCQKAKSQVNV